MTCGLRVSGGHSSGEGEGYDEGADGDGFHGFSAPVFSAWIKDFAGLPTEKSINSTMG
jgi:hypothetical protein